ncbi:MAG TPA: aminoglycoside adenylyltransferase domain-containing protein [Armatimonadota bacterium]|nr:aminoglycoside adenylyltransferase domain-containing protein [Armatimonadota bacterium]
MNREHPTPDAPLNSVLQDLVTSVQAILGDNFIGAYLQGSFAIGDWDYDSDVDFIIALDHDVNEAELPALQAMHGRIYDGDSNWAKHLEGSYFPKEILRRADPAKSELYFLDNTFRELIRSNHCNTLVVRWAVRERGIVLAGPDPRELIDPVSADDLRQEVMVTMREWAQQLFANPEQMDNRWFQPYAVLSYCRMLHTLETGTIESKLAGARWAAGALDSRWTGLIERAWADRPDPSWKVRQKANPDDLKSTIDFIRYALEVGRMPSG